MFNDTLARTLFGVFFWLALVLAATHLVLYITAGKRNNSQRELAIFGGSIAGGTCLIAGLIWFLYPLF